MSRRIGRWQYDRRVGWRLDGTDLVLDFDRLDKGGDLQGCYVLYRTPQESEVTGVYVEPVDHYLDAAMRWVEEHEAAYVAGWPT